jgi:hypothetical protein
VGRLIPVPAGYSSDGFHPAISDPAQHATSTRMPTEDDFRQVREAYLRLAPEPGHFEAFAELIPGAQLAVLPGATHIGGAAPGDLIVPLVSRFLS